MTPVCHFTGPCEICSRSIFNVANVGEGEKERGEETKWEKLCVCECVGGGWEDTDTRTYQKIDKGQRENYSDILGRDVRPRKRESLWGGAKCHGQSLMKGLAGTIVR